ncbi:MAG TPA: ribokinase [Candidatus Melainabacteria bacterium]|nr:ribokinase [Candidatus Melainabacteria bacterium]HIN66620.1 ribokinase [Candidatus Obscuribacterales bacterium]
MKADQVIVVGSLSQDIVVSTPRLPVKGETIRGSNFGMFAGGKGNNQAMAAGRAGAKVAMVGRVGADSFGDMLIQTLKKNNVDASHMVQDKEAGTGIAMITVDGDGDNSIIIAQRANLNLCDKDIEKAESVFSQSKILLMQLEVPTEADTFAAKLAHKHGTFVALNPAPAPVDGKLPKELLENVDVIIPNQTEAELMTGIKVVDEKSAQAAADELRKLGPKNIIITLGELGALLSEEGKEAVLIPSYKVNAIDTTAAGDAFCGAMAAAYAGGESLVNAVKFGCAAGALATTKMGAEPSLPTKEEIEKLLLPATAK